MIGGNELLSVIRVITVVESLEEVVSKLLDRLGNKAGLCSRYFSFDLDIKSNGRWKIISIQFLDLGKCVTDRPEKE